MWLLVASFQGGVQAKENMWAEEGSSREAAIPLKEDILKKFFDRYSRRYSLSILVTYRFLSSVEECDEREIRPWVEISGTPWCRTNV